jgi:hypothetical protein
MRASTLKTPADVTQHLRHERHAVEAAVRVERREDLGVRPNLDEVTSPQVAHEVLRLLELRVVGTS